MGLVLCPNQWPLQVLLVRKPPSVSETKVPTLSFSLIQNSKTKYKINKHFIQLKLQIP
jgi:hypothetical protein